MRACATCAAGHGEPRASTTQAEASKRLAAHARDPDGLRGPNAPQAGAPETERTSKRRSWAHAGRLGTLACAAAACRTAPLRAFPRRSRPRRSERHGSASASARHRRLAAAASGPGRLEGACQGGGCCQAVAGASATRADAWSRARVCARRRCLTPRGTCQPSAATARRSTLRRASPARSFSTW